MIYLTVIIARKDDFKLRRESVVALSIDSEEEEKYKFTFTYVNGYSETIMVNKNDFLNISTLFHTLEE